MGRIGIGKDRGKFSVASVEALDLNGNGTKIFSDMDNLLRQSENRIDYNVKRLFERAFLLAHFHCGAEMGDFEGFAKGSEDVKTIRNKLRWVDWERYSTRQQARMKFGGWVGEITYKGDFQKYLPLLSLGEHIHVGKATTFGLGKYRIKQSRALLGMETELYSKALNG